MTTTAIPPRQRRRLPHTQAFWVMLVVFPLLMSFTTIPTPLYPLYQASEHFAAFTITVIFAAYGIGVAAGLFLVGHLSDHYGRRPMLLAGAGLELVSALLFASSTHLPVLLVARAISGFGIGMLTAATTALIAELWTRAHPDRDPRFGATVATAANTGGLALGPLIGALLTQWWSDPLHLPYEVYAGVIVVLMVLVALVPETAAVPEQRPGYRPQRVVIEAHVRADFTSAAIGAAAAFSVLGTFNALTSIFVSGTLGHHSRLLAGSIVFVVLGMSAVVPILLDRRSLTDRLRTGRALMVVGMLGMSTSAALGSLAVYVLAGMVAGGGVGLVFAAAIGFSVQIASPERRAETVAGMFLAAYVGITVPVIAVGVAVTLSGNATAVLIVFGLLVASVVGTAVGRMLKD